MVTYTRTYYTRDNSGIIEAQGVNLFGPDNGPAKVLASLVQVLPGRKFQRGDLIRIYVYGTAKARVRHTGTTVRLHYNGASVTKPDGTPIATKTWSPAWLETKDSDEVKILQFVAYVL